jgi:Poly(R)-hydroxyalkanoic acid synthase subunit (PHA_synth_III_E)
MTTPPDPSAFFRDMLGQWENAVNSFGGEAMKTEEFSRGMNAATAATAQMQASMNQATKHALAAANLPSRSDIEALTARIAAVEATLLRIEAKLVPTAPDPSKPRPTRSRKPPAAK